MMKKSKIRTFLLGFLFLSLGGATVYAAPPVPRTPEAEATSPTGVRVTWDRVNRATTYHLYRATSRNGNYRQIYWANGRSYFDRGFHLNPGTRYYYRVSAENNMGESGPSLARSVTTPSGRPDGQATGPRSIELSWVAFDGAELYRLWRASSSNGNYRQIYFGQNRAYTDSGNHLQPDTTYYYKVQGDDDNGNQSSFSGVRSVRTDEERVLGNLDLVSPNDRSTNQSKTLNLQWQQDNPRADAYRVFVDTDRNVLDGLQDDNDCNRCDYQEPTNAQSHRIPAGRLQSNTRYYWRVRGWSDGFPIVYSSIWSFTTGTITNIRPSNGTYGTGGFMTVTWSYGSEPANTPLIISIKRDSCIVNGNETCNAGDVNWRRLEIGTRNDGSQTVTIPNDVALANDWRVYMVDQNDASSLAVASGTFIIVRPEIVNVQPSQGRYILGDAFDVTWTYRYVSQDNPMVISIKRDSCIVNGNEACNVGDRSWRRLELNTPNDGRQMVILPEDIQPAVDWRVYVADANNPGRFTAAGGTLTFEVPRPEINDLGAACIGHDYEQRIPLRGARLPTIDRLEAESNPVDEGRTVLITSQVTVDQARGGRPFYYWCADRGGFLEEEGFPSFDRVRFVAPPVNGRDQGIGIRLWVGDTLGYVARRSLNLTIRDVNGLNAQDPRPQASIETPGDLLVGDLIRISFTVQDRNERGEDTTGQLTTMISVLVNGNEEILARGMRGEANGFLWIPRVAGNYQLKLETSDGNQTTTVFSNPFRVSDAYSLSGYVIDLQGSGLSNVEVFLEGQGSVYTDGSGYFRFSGLSAGRYALRAIQEGHFFGDFPVVVDLDANSPHLRVNLFERFRPVADADGDGVEDGQDNCPNIQNMDQQNTDGDQEGDACDPDDDNDGIDDALDLCPLIQDQSQEDFDGDGIGDLCDEDRDGDGILNYEDQCAATPLGIVPDQFGCTENQRPCGPFNDVGGHRFETEICALVNEGYWPVRPGETRFDPDELVTLSDELNTLIRVGGFLEEAQAFRGGVCEDDPIMSYAAHRRIIKVSSCPNPNNSRRMVSTITEAGRVKLMYSYEDAKRFKTLVKAYVALGGPDYGDNSQPYGIANSYFNVAYMLGALIDFDDNLDPLDRTYGNRLMSKGEIAFIIYHMLELQTEEVNNLPDHVAYLEHAQAEASFPLDYNIDEPMGREYLIGLAMRLMKNEGCLAYEDVLQEPFWGLPGTYEYIADLKAAHDFDIWRDGEGGFGTSASRRADSIWLYRILRAVAQNGACPQITHCWALYSEHRDEIHFHENDWQANALPMQATCAYLLDALPLATVDENGLIDTDFEEIPQAKESLITIYRMLQLEVGE
jgi:hypothetical protein